MSRPTTNTDLKLIQVAREMLPHVGASGLSLREIARKAEVNLGMFHYHFKNKNDFVKRVLEQIYEEFFKEFSLESSKESSPEENLRGMLLTFAKFTRDNRHLLAALLGDVMNQDKVVLGFVRENFIRHIELLSKVIHKGQKEEVFEDIPIAQAMAFLMSSVNLPNVIGGQLEKQLGGKMKMELDLKKTVLSDKALEQRVSMALRGFAKVAVKVPVKKRKS